MIMMLQSKQVSKRISDTACIAFNVWIISAAFFGYILPVLADASESDYLLLYNRLLGNYSRHLRPLKNQTATLVVSLQFDLLSVYDIDDVKQRISALAVVSVQWSDKNLVWNPDDYGGIDRMYFNEDQIWAPTVYIEESQAKGPTLYNLPTTHLVLPDGTVTFGSSGVLETSCSLDMTYFPYDYQSCKFGFGILDSSRKDVSLVSDERGPQKAANYVHDGEWTVHDFGTAVKFTGMKNYEIQTLYILLKLQRRSTYYVLNVIVPAVTVSLLSLITFAVPVESGERLAYALTNLLSLSVYITYIGSIMPSSSVDLPIILRYLVSLFIISSMCVVMTVVVIAVRWSRVVIVNDKLKSVFIFGFPVTFKRKEKLFGIVSRSARPGRFLETNPSVESTSMCSSELQSLCESPQEKVLLDDPIKGKETGKRSKPVTPNNFVTGNVRHPVPSDNPKINSPEDIKKVLREPFAEFDLVSAEMDPDIVYMCSRLDLVSFSVLFFSFLVMTVHSFVLMTDSSVDHEHNSVIFVFRSCFNCYI